jgi:hypothetical protein
MKKVTILLVVIMTAGAFVGKAQIQRGNVLVGGDLADFSLGLNKGSQFSMDISPKAAWFIRDNTAVGTYVNLKLVTGGGSGTAVTYGVGALAREYLGGNALNVLKHTRFFAEANVGIEGVNYSKGESTNGLGIGFGPGIAYFVTPNIGLEGLLKYQGILGFGTAATTSNLNLNVGFQIYLPGRNTIRNTKRDIQ